MSNWIERAAAVALVVIGAARADAQITAVIAPPKKVEAKAQEAARREEVAQDSIARVTLTGMKQWVDSAAGSLALRPDTGTAPSETTVPRAPTSTRADSATTPARPAAASDSVFRDGARAPNTATPVPTVALIGGSMVAAGLVLRRRRRPVAQRQRLQ